MLKEIYNAADQSIINILPFPADINKIAVYSIPYRVIHFTQCWKGISEEKKVQPILLLDYDFGI